jgi:hypothetical protein
MLLICQIGYSKTLGKKKEGQIVKAYVNDVECTWADKSGKFLTSFVETRKGQLWYLWSGEVNSGDFIKLEVATGVRGAGVDEQRTFESVYVVDSGASLREIDVSGVGKRGYPLLKGKFVHVGTFSAADQREIDISEFLNDDNFED